MRTRVFCTLVLSLFLLAWARSQSTPPFDVDAYRTFLNSHRDMDAAGLQRLYPAGVFKASAPVAWGSAYYADLIDQAYHLTDYEKSLVQHNGFMVSERLLNPAMISGLIDVYNHDLPVFVSSDAILHALHKSYDQILKGQEHLFLIPRLDSLLTCLHAQLPALVQKYHGTPAISTSLQDLDLYLVMPRILLSPSGNVAPLFPENISRVNDLLTLIQQENLSSYPLFGTYRRTIDFSQFTPRGHYTETEELKRYFKAMIWLGRTEIWLRPPLSFDPPPPPSDIQRQVIDAVLLDEAARDGNAMPILESIDRLLRFFVGDMDNVTLTNIHDLVLETGISDASALVDSIRYEAFCSTLEQKSYAFQRILSQVLISDPMTPEAIRPASSFLLLGQRFVIDSYVTGNVVFDRILYQQQKITRMLPSALDILFALGNDAAGQLLAPELDNYHYGSNLAALRYLIDSYEPGFWHGTIYNNWLQAIRTLAPPADRSSLPAFMQTAAWWQEKMNSQLSSWSQLRHDNLLYAKQSYSGVAGCSFPLSYVEPIPRLYESLRTLADSGAAFFAAGGYQGGSALSAYFSRMRGIMDTLAVIARGELESRLLTDAETSFLRRMLFSAYGGCTTVYVGWYTDLFYGTFGINGIMEGVVADVHTAPSDEAGNIVGWVMHGGTGPVNMAVVVAPLPGYGPTAFIGPVMSYYEVITNDFKRLTDEEWKTAYARPPSARPALVNLYLAGGLGGARGPAVSLLTGVEPPYVEPTIPGQAELWQNYPNPFNPRTTISFQLPVAAPVRLTVFDMLGRQVAQLINGPLPPGRHLVRFDGATLASGVYAYRLETGGRQITRTMVLVR